MISLNNIISKILISDKMAIFTKNFYKFVIVFAKSFCKLVDAITTKTIVISIIVVLNQFFYLDDRSRLTIKLQILFLLSLSVAI